MDASCHLLSDELRAIVPGKPELGKRRPAEASMHTRPCFNSAALYQFIVASSFPYQAKKSSK